MDVIETAYAHRARAALDMLTEGATTSHERKAKAFCTIAKEMARTGRNETALSALRAHATDELIQKAVGQALDVNELWSGPLAQQLAASYIESIAEFSLFDQMAKYARMLTPAMRQVMIASDAVGNMATEGAPKPVIDLSLTLGDVDPLKAVAIVVMSNELARATGPEGQALFERELEKAATRALNASVLALFNDSGTSVVAAGTDPLASMRAGLQAAGPSLGFVVAMGTGDAAWLATHEANRGAGVRGGEFAPGIHIVAVDDLAGMRIFPASRFALFDGGLRVASTDAATIDMRDTPESPATPTSMFQTDSSAVLVERLWHVAGDTSGVVTVEGD